MNQVAPEMVLGKDVLDARGGRVGAVVDVGIHDMRRVKFLVVQNEPEASAELVRLGVERIERIGARTVSLKPS